MAREVGAFVVAVAGDDEDGARGQVGGDALQEGEAFGVGPVHVFQQDEQGLVRGEEELSTVRSRRRLAAWASSGGGAGMSTPSTCSSCGTSGWRTLAWKGEGGTSRQSESRMSRHTR